MRPTNQEFPSSDRCPETARRADDGRMGAYADAYRTSLADPSAFWGAAARDIEWYRPPVTVLDDSAPPFYRWFPDGVLNTCFNARRPARPGRARRAGRDRVRQPGHRHPAHPDLRRAAGPDGALRRRAPASRCGPRRPRGDLHADGARGGRGDARLRPARRRALGGVRRLRPARVGRPDRPRPAHRARHRLVRHRGQADRRVPADRRAGAGAGRPTSPRSVVLLQRPQAPATPRAGRDVDWHDALGEAEPVDCVPVAATDPLYILYTSGTTARPKGVVRDNGGHAVALRWSMRHVYDTHPGETMWTASDIGWVVGHSYIVYAPLLAGCTSVLYEGKPVGTPDAGAFWRVAAEHEVKTMFTAPTAFRAIRRDDPTGAHLDRYDLSEAALPVPGRRAARPGHVHLGPGPARHPGDRPLVADRDRLAGRGQPDGPRAARSRAPARPPSRCPGTTCGWSTTTASRPARGRS